MSFQSTIKFSHEDKDFFTITSEPKEHAHDMVLSIIYKLLAILYMGDNKFDDDTIEHLKMRVEALRVTKE